jgi:hypothetical protein
MTMIVYALVDAASLVALHGVLGISLGFGLIISHPGENIGLDGQQIIQKVMEVHTDFVDKKRCDQYTTHIKYTFTYLYL